MTPTVALAIPHCPWDEARVKSLARLLEGVQPERAAAFKVCSGPGPEPNQIWSQRLWQWGIEQMDADHLLVLEDDVIPSPHFWDILGAILKTHPHEIIGLEAIHPSGLELANAGFRSYTTIDCLCGVGYVMPIEELKCFLEWRHTALRPGACLPGGIDSDTMIGVWTAVTGRKIWHPLPTPIDHDVEMTSIMGNQNHQNRRPVVRWNMVTSGADKLLTPEYWGDREGPHLGRFYNATPYFVARWVKEWEDATIVRIERDLVRIQRIEPDPGYSVT